MVYSTQNSQRARTGNNTGEGQKLSSQATSNRKGTEDTQKRTRNIHESSSIIPKSAYPREQQTQTTEKKLIEIDKNKIYSKFAAEKRPEKLK